MSETSISQQIIDNPPTQAPSQKLDAAAVGSEALFGPEQQVNNFRRYAVAAGVGIASLAGAGIAYKFGVEPQQVSGLLDFKIVPSVQAYPVIVDGMVAVNEGLRSVSPVIATGGVSAYLLSKSAARSNPRQQKINELARVDYSGVDGSVSSEQNTAPNFRDKVRKRTRKLFAAGVGVAALTTLLVGGSSGVEHEVSNGPLRPVDRLFDTLAPNVAERNVLVQSPNNSFMDDSYLERSQVNDMIKNAPSTVHITPFNKLLPNIDGRSGLVISIPDQLFTDTTGVKIEDNCKTIPVVLDNANDTPVGRSVEINGRESQVVAKVSGTSQMNRDVALMSDSDMRNCIQDEAETSYYGAVITGDEQAAERLMKAEGFDNHAHIISQSKFEANNKKFWRANGTPILLQLMAYVGILGAFATGNERRGALQRNIKEIGILNAQGVSIKSISKIESMRALVETNKAALIAAPLMPVMAAVFNMAETGLRVGVGARELAVGYSVTLFAKLFGGRRAVKKFSKQLDVAEVVKV